MYKNFKFVELWKMSNENSPNRQYLSISSSFRPKLLLSDGEKKIWRQTTFPSSLPFRDFVRISYLSLLSLQLSQFSIALALYRNLSYFFPEFALSAPCPANFFPFLQIGMSGFSTFYLHCYVMGFFPSSKKEQGKKSWMRSPCFFSPRKSGKASQIRLQRANFAPLPRRMQQLWLVLENGPENPQCSLQSASLLM